MNTNLAHSIVEDLQKDYPREGCGVILNKRGKLQCLYIPRIILQILP